MESIPMEMDDIFDDYEEADDFIPTRLPDLEDELEPMQDDRENEGEAEEVGETDNAELLAKLKSMKGASKHTTRKSMPKLDATRLTGERGIPVLPKAFSNITFKGKGHEVEDLKVIMRHMEHWAHRLFPKMPFAEVLERAERLGAKKEVQTCVKKIRLDMPVLASDQVPDEEDEVQRMGQRESDDDDQEQETRQTSEDRVQHRVNEIDEDEIEELLRDQELAERSQKSQHDSQSPASLSQTKEPASLSQTKDTAKNGMTDEVRERIERNKRLALERRAAAKLLKHTQADNSQTSKDADSIASPSQKFDSQVSEIHSSPLANLDDLINKEDTTNTDLGQDISLTD